MNWRSKHCVCICSPLRSSPWCRHTHSVYFHSDSGTHRRGCVCPNHCVCVGTTLQIQLQLQIQLSAEWYRHTHSDTETHTADVHAVQTNVEVREQWIEIDPHWMYMRWLRGTKWDRNQVRSIHSIDVLTRTVDLHAVTHTQWYRDTHSACSCGDTEEWS